MFLKKVRLQNFKCHTDLTIDFTVFDGGKIPVRKTIALVTGGSDALGRHPGFPDAYIRHGQQSASIETVIATAQGEERELSLLLQRGEGLRSAVERARTTLAPMDAALRHTHRSYFVAGYGSGRRVAPVPAGAVRLYPLAARGLLLIDEADMHLHPAWQAQLHQFFAKGLPQMQVIAAAYSPVTAGEAVQEEVWKLHREDATALASPVELHPHAGRLDQAA